VLPLLVLLTGVWLGARAALRAGLLTMLTVPGVVIASGAAGLGPGLSGQETVPLLVAITLAIGVTLLMLTLFLRTLGQLLRQSEADRRRVRELLDDTPDAILALDIDERVEQANPAAARLLDSELESLHGTRVQELAMTPIDGTWAEALIQLRVSSSPLEFRTSGQQRILEAIARRRTRPDGSEGALLVLRDITARREAERQTQALHAKLQHAQKLEAVGILAGSVAHDFNNLLTAVAGYGSLLQMSADPEARGYATELTAMQERGAALVRQLLSYARRDVAEPRPVDLAAMLSALTPLMQRVAGEQVQLSLRVDETCPVVADPGQLEQVMLNLVANARDAMPGGGEILVQCQRIGERVLLEVRDTGEGIPEELHGQIFDHFFTTKEPGKGTGLGLSTAASIVREAGGTIQVRSAVSQGSTFIISLPTTDQIPAAVVTQTTPRTSRMGAGRHIVVAEDNDAVRSYLKLMLERAGFRVTLARSGDEAAAKISTMARSPDLLLSDVVMPGRTGPQLAADARVRFPDLPVLFMSGYAGEAGEHSDFVAGDALAKPFSDQELIERIEAKLSRRPRASAAG
jgi:PAS domain S-box-containing protein